MAVLRLRALATFPGEPGSVPSICMVATYLPTYVCNSSSSGHRMQMLQRHCRQNTSFHSSQVIFHKGITDEQLQKHILGKGKIRVPRALSHCHQSLTRGLVYG